MGNPRTLVAIPMMHYVDAGFFTSIMGLKRVGDIQIGVEIDSLVYEARNRLVMLALDKEVDYILWLDSDMIFQPDLLDRFVQDMEQGHDFVAGLCFKRKLPTMPVILKELTWDLKDKGEIEHKAVYYEDYPKDDFFEIAGCGFGCVMMRTSLITDMAQYFGMSPFTPMPYLGEDYSFCWRVKQIGKKMFCDSRIKLGHMGQKIYNEEDYLKQIGEK